MVDVQRQPCRPRGRGRNQRRLRPVPHSSHERAPVPAALTQAASNFHRRPTRRSSPHGVTARRPPDRRRAPSSSPATRRAARCSFRGSAPDLARAPHAHPAEVPSGQHSGAPGRQPGSRRPRRAAPSPETLRALRRARAHRHGITGLPAAARRASRKRGRRTAHHRSPGIPARFHINQPGPDGPRQSGRGADRAPHGNHSGDRTPSAPLAPGRPRSPWRAKLLLPARSGPTPRHGICALLSFPQPQHQLTADEPLTASSVRALALGRMWQAHQVGAANFACHD